MLSFRSIIALAALSSTTVLAASPGKIVGIVDQNAFCLLLPASPGISIGESEGSGQSFCLGDLSTSGSKSIASGAILSAHVIKTDAYMQVTGKIDESLLGINTADGGGQYDNASHGSEPRSGADASLQGFANYVELVGNGVYCMRTCATSGEDEASPCNMHRDRDGCDAVIGGSYNDGFTFEDKSSGRNVTSTATAASRKTTQTDSPPPPPKSTETPSSTHDSTASTATDTATKTPTGTSIITYTAKVFTRSTATSSVTATVFTTHPAYTTNLIANGSATSRVGFLGLTLATLVFGSAAIF
ncbi:hypothetical protein HK101_002667 [Irineochytrium annulatum]|nr:hypothetical protein HK101_002667 [Irineochytrium annulatum]